MLCFGPFRLDALNEQLWCGTELLTIQPRALDVLQYLAERCGRLVTKQELLDALWGNVNVGEAALKTQLKVIRQTIGDEARSPRFIQTVHRRGYRFVAPVGRDSNEVSLRRELVAAPRTGPLCGREAELARLDEALQRSFGGQRNILFVTGEPGAGKTSLVNAFVGPLKRRGDVCVAWGQCIEQYGPSEAYLPILEAFGRLARAPGATHVVELLRQRAPTLLMHMPDLWEAPQLSTLGRIMASATPERMLRELADVLQPLTEIRPLVLLLEDLHLADRCTLEWVAYLARRSEPARLLVLGTYRSTRVCHSDHPLWAVHQGLAISGHCGELRLARLTERDIFGYLEARLGAGALPGWLSPAVHAHTSGNPLFMSRIVDSLLERGLLDETQDPSAMPAPGDAIMCNIPPSIIAAIEIEMDQLAPFERGVLEAASVAGAHFSTTVLAVALGQELALVEQLCLRWLRQERFLGKREAQAALGREPTIQCEFIHSLYQTVIYERIAPTRRSLLHRRVALAEEGLQGNRAREIAGRLAWHFERGGDLSRAGHYRKVAGEQALRLMAYQEAVEHFAAALDLIERSGACSERLTAELDVRLALGVPLAMTRGYADPDVQTLYQRAADLCREIGNTPRGFPSKVGLINFYLVRGQFAGARALAEELFASACAGDDPRLECEAACALGVAAFYQGDSSLSLARLGRVVELHAQLDRQTSVFPLDPMITALSHSAVSLWLTGFPDQALAKAEAALALAEEEGEPFGIALALDMLAIVHFCRREPALVQARAEALGRLSADRGFAFFEIVATSELGMARILGGDLEGGIALLREGWAAQQATGAEIGGTHWSAVLADAHLARGDTARAVGALADAFGAAWERGERFFEPELYRVHGELLRVAPRAALEMPSPALRQMTARAAFEKALSLAKQNGFLSLELRAAMSLMRWWSSEGQPHVGRAILAGVLGRVSEGSGTADLLDAERLVG